MIETLGGSNETLTILCDRGKCDSLHEKTEIANCSTTNFDQACKSSALAFSCLKLSHKESKEPFPQGLGFLILCEQ